MVSDELVMLVPFEARLYCDFKVAKGRTTLYCSDNLHEKRENQDAVAHIIKAHGVDLNLEEAVYSAPPDIEDAEAISVNNDEQGIVTISGLSANTKFQPYTHKDFQFDLVKGDKSSEQLNEFFKSDKHNFIAILDDIATRYNVHIIMSLTVDSDNFNILVKIIGNQTSISGCDHQMMALIDMVTNEFNSNEYYTTESILVEADSFLPFLLNKQNEKFVKTHMSTSMFVPELVQDMNSGLIATQQQHVILSGNVRAMTLRAKSALQKRLQFLKENIYYKRINNLSEAKLLFLHKFCAKDISEFMINSQCYVKVGNNSVEFQAASPIILNNTVKQFTLQFLQEVVELTVSLKEGKDSSAIIMDLVAGGKFESQYVVVIPALMSDKFILCTKQAYLVKYTNDQYENTTTLKDEETIKQLKVTFEVNVEYEDFICGKKNGKLTRIIDNVDSAIELSNNSRTSYDNQDDTMNVSIISDVFKNFKTSLNNFVNELPAEESFFIPEVYHRPIIGSGGAIVQTIMRKHNVFIQFSNSFSLPQNNLGITRYDNVIIRCPTKNKRNIEPVTSEILKLVQDFSYLQTTKSLKLTNNRFENIILATLDNSNLEALIQIEKTYNVFIDFPTDLSQSDNEPVALKVTGNDESAVSEAIQEFTQSKSEWANELALKLSANFRQYAQKQENVSKLYNEVIVPLEQMFEHILLSVNVPNAEISLSYNDVIKNKKDNFNKIIEFITLYLIKQGITIISKTEVPDFVEE